MWQLARGSASARSNPSSRTKAVAVAVMVAFSAGLAVKGWYDLAASRRLAAEGESTTARIIGKRIERTGGRRRTTNHMIDVEYRTTTGTVLKASDRVREGLFNRARPGDSVTLHYMLDDPSHHALGREVRPDYFMLLTSAVAFIVTVIFAIFGNGVWRARWGR